MSRTKTVRALQAILPFMIVSLLASLSWGQGSPQNPNQPAQQGNQAQEYRDNIYNPNAESYGRAGIENALRQPGDLANSFMRNATGASAVREVPLLPDFAQADRGSDIVTTASGGDTEVYISAIEVRDTIPEVESEIREIVDVYQGRTLTISELIGLADALTRKIRASGYLLSQVVLPPQEIVEGRVVYRMIQGYIGNVRVEGAPDGLLEAIRRTLEPVTSQSAVTLDMLERQLLLVREMYGVVVVPVLRPDRSGGVGSAELFLKVNYDRYDTFTVLHNEGSEYYNRTRMQVGTYVSLPWGNSARFGASVTGDGTFQNSRSAVLSYSQLLNGGLRMDFSFSGSESELANNSGTLTLPLQNQSSYFSFELSWPILKQRRASYRLAYGLRGNDFTSTIIPEDNVSDPYDIHDVARRAHHVSLLGESYYRGSKFNAFTTMRYEISGGVEGMGASIFEENDNYLALRSDAASDFVKFTVDWSGLYWFDSGWRLRWSLLAQAVDEPLPASEEISFGGDRFGRGYDGGEASGDRGAALAFEVGHSIGSRFYMFIFADQSWLYNLRDERHELLPELEDQSLSSVGLGARVSFARGNRGNVELYTATPDSEVGSTGEKTNRVYGRISYNF
ncbi:MAG: ShlB/FhaC/HecB family hemolysin secretion/activation protein [Gammaproteobacteria bacterium AqS3]|nr:ShlB/FhaC/HecB family hemolysin secretion/activation protein [Gammaproteobacteria bacterium AqS3]